MQPPPRLRPANTAAPGFSARRRTSRTPLPNPCPFGCPRRGLLAQAEGGTGHGHSSYARVAEGPPRLEEGTLGCWKDADSGMGSLEWWKVLQNGGLASATVPLRVTLGCHGAPVIPKLSLFPSPETGSGWPSTPGAFHRWEAWINSR